MTLVPTNQTHRLALFGVLFIGLTLAGLYAVYDRFAGRDIELDPRLFQPGVVAALVALLGFYYLADALRLGYTLKALGHRIPLRRLWRLVFINLFFSNITPMATGGGLAQIWYLRQEGVTLGHATAATTLRTLLAVAYIFTLTPVCLLVMSAFNGELIRQEIGLALALFGLLYLIFFVFVIGRTRALVGLLLALLGRLRRWHWIGERRYRHWRYRAMREPLRFAHSFRVFVSGDRRPVLAAVFWTGLFLLSLFSFPAVLLWALGYEVDYVTVLGLLLVTTFVMYFSPTPGASGISEGVFGHFFQPLIGTGHLLLVTLSWRLLTIYLGMAVGLWVFKRSLARSLLNEPKRQSQ